MLMLFYLFMTMYCTPYNALIPELGADQKTRMAISTSISFTYIAGMAMAYLAPVIWGMLQGMGLERVLAIRLTFTGMALIGMICMFVPVFTIREKDYVVAAPSESTPSSPWRPPSRTRISACSWPATSPTSWASPCSRRRCPSSSPAC